MFLFAFWIHVVGELFDIYWQKKKLGKLVTAMISRGLIALTPLWHFLCRRQCDYPTSIVPGFHTGKQLKFTRNQVGKEYTTSTEHPNSKPTPFCPLMVLTMTRTNQGWNYRILQVKINVQQIRWLWTMGSLFPSKKRSKYLWHQIDHSQRISFHLSDIWQWKRKAKHCYKRDFEL